MNRDTPTEAAARDLDPGEGGPRDAGPRDAGPRDTKEALLDAAEALFEEQGATATSLRAITERAGANVAAVNYHFGSKDALVFAVMERRIRPLNEQRLALLDRLEAEGRADVEAVLEALLAPALQYAEGRKGFLRLLGRLHFETDLKVRGLLLENFAEVVRRFVAALHSQLPHLTPEDVLWRLHFSIGAMAMAATNRQDLAHFSRGACDGGDSREATRRLVAFLAGGFRAPRVETEPAQRSQDESQEESQEAKR
ncbi:MAG TPA: TetR/AcrR family transcriptional regulator [Thermoanaerobaculia bacterium]|nr:TetR/AcrR family transcriptional regulator [Thermoanaerobaculia bacterium]